MLKFLKSIRIKILLASIECAVPLIRFLKSKGVKLILVSCMLYIIHTIIIQVGDPKVEVGTNLFKSESDVLVLAKFFPQFHEFRENDLLWGRGYTDYKLLKPNISWFGGKIIKPDKFTQCNTKIYMDELNFNVKELKVDVLVIDFYWMGYQIMEKCLNMIANDGRFTFMLHWANEPWTRNWDGGDRGILIDQRKTLNDTDLEMLKGVIQYYVKNPNYFQINGKPLFLIYDINYFTNTEDIVDMLKSLNLIIGESNRPKWVNGKVIDKLPSMKMDFMVEYEPLSSNYFDEIREVYCLHPNSIPGTFVGWNNFPRHQKGFSFSEFILQDKVTFKNRLNSLSRRLELCGSYLPKMVFIQALNEWSEGNSIMNSTTTVELFETFKLHKFSNMRAIHDKTVIIRTYHSHIQNGILSKSLKFWCKLDINIIILNSDVIHAKITKLMADNCDFMLYNCKYKYDIRTDGGYKCLDEVILTLNDFKGSLLITNADNKYTQNPFIYSESTQFDFRSRWGMINKRPHDEFYVDLSDNSNVDDYINAGELKGQVDLGSVVWDFDKIREMFAYGQMFSVSNCYRCQDWDFFIKYKSKFGMKVKNDLIFLHQPTHDDCIYNGGYWLWISEIFSFGCYNVRELTEFFYNRYNGRFHLIAKFENNDVKIKPCYNNLYKNIRNESHFDIWYYKHENGDLRHISDEDLWTHWTTFGIYESRKFRLKFNPEFTTLMLNEKIKINQLNDILNNLILDCKDIPDLICYGEQPIAWDFDDGFIMRSHFSFCFRGFMILRTVNDFLKELFDFVS